MVPAALWMALTMLVSPEALPQEVVDAQARLDLGLASHPFTVQAMHPPRAATSIPSTGSIRRRGFWRAGPTRRTLGRWWLLGCTCILGREGRDVQAFGASMGWGNGEDYSGRRTWLGFLACR
jgi:hypothetical protein